MFVFVYLVGYKEINFGFVLVCFRQEIVIWASKKTGESVIRVNSDIQAKEFLKKHSMFAVGLFEKFEVCEVILQIFAQSGCTMNAVRL